MGDIGFFIFIKIMKGRKTLVLHCKEIENRKKVSKEMEEKLLKTMKQKQ